MDVGLLSLTGNERLKPKQLLPCVVQLTIHTFKREGIVYNDMFTQWLFRIMQKKDASNHRFAYIISSDVALL